MLDGGSNYRHGPINGPVAVPCSLVVFSHWKGSQLRGVGKVFTILNGLGDFNK